MSSRLQSAEDATKAFTTKAARLEICRSKARDYSARTPLGSTTTYMLLHMCRRGGAHSTKIGVEGTKKTEI